MGDLRPFPGARARICGLQSRPELNGQEGVLRDEQNDRWLVLLDTMGSTDTPLAVKPTNLEILGMHALEIHPTDAPSTATPIPASSMHIAPTFIQGGTETEEKEFLVRTRNWIRVVGLKAYTKKGIYPDLYVYFDFESREPANFLATKAFTMYTRDIGGLPTGGSIRGSVVAVRAEFPADMCCSKPTV
eukprot:GEMP01104073.1.p1 GENE.GEMP01104073.1~~GEMP01104073.1.p1  ORF type:complete len:188 (+),score=27.04 GEMP01104073.1:37-600(+)